MNTQKQKKLLVSGLSGLVGSRFRQLYSNDYEMNNLDLSSGVDITDPNRVEEVFGANSDADGVIHLAAYTNLNAAQEQSGDNQGLCYRVNVVGTKVIAEAAARHGFYLVHVSTDYVFDGQKTEAYVETDSPNPIEWYGQTKLMAEEEVRKVEIDKVILRLAFPYQAKPMRPDMILKMRQGFENNNLYPLFSDHFLTPTFVDDVADVFNFCALNRPTGLYHMTGSSSHSDFEIGQMVKRIFGYQNEVSPGLLAEYLEKNPRPYQKSLKISNSKLKQEFGIKMRNLEEGLEEIKHQL